MVGVAEVVGDLVVEGVVAEDVAEVPANHLAILRSSQLTKFPLQSKWEAALILHVEATLHRLHMQV